jgi:response regulator RpfG family c-di-GMP phosphodiesterase
LSNIVFGLVLSNKSYSNIIANELLSMGIISFQIEKPEKVIETIESKKINFLFLDFDFAENSSYKLMEDLNSLNKEGNSSIYVISTSFNSNKKFIDDMKKYSNVISIIAKPIERETVRNKIILILDKFKENFPRRKHIRVKPDDDELMRVSFRLKNNKYLSAKVIDISLGGLAALLYTKYESPELSDGLLLEHMVFEAGLKEIDVDAKIITKKDTFLAVNFTHFYHDSYTYLTKYIMKKLTV